MDEYKRVNGVWEKNMWIHKVNSVLISHSFGVEKKLNMFSHYMFSIAIRACVCSHPQPRRVYLFIRGVCVCVWNAMEGRCSGSKRL